MGKILLNKIKWVHIDTYKKFGKESNAKLCNSCLDLEHGITDNYQDFPDAIDPQDLIKQEDWATKQTRIRCLQSRCKKRRKKKNGTQGYYLWKDQNSRCSQER